LDFVQRFGETVFGAGELSWTARWLRLQPTI